MGKHGGAHGSGREPAEVLSAEALGAAERIHRNTAAHWRRLIDDPDHPGQRVEIQVYAQRQRARSHRMAQGLPPAEPPAHGVSSER